MIARIDVLKDETISDLQKDFSDIVMLPHGAPSRYKLKKEGLFYINDNSNEEFIASRIEVIALARDKSSENWGRLLEFNDADGKVHQWAMPMEMLRGSGEDLRGELLRLGLEIAAGPKARHRLLEYIISSKPCKRVRCINRTGWHDSVYVFPNKTYPAKSADKESLVYQSEHLTKSFSQSGTFEEWKNNVSALCVGNSRLIISISIGFASILLNLINAESGGLHFVGESSSGKTTALKVAASVFGGDTFLSRWRATTNGLEGLAVARCDALLILDELAQVEPREAGEIAYMLANGVGKTRANRSGAARLPYEWRLLFISAGEIGLAQHMSDGGKKIRAGQEVRLVDIPADAGKGYGMFENLHGYDSGADFSKALNERCSNYYGTAILVFLENITSPENYPQIPLMLKKLKQSFINIHLPKNASGQVHRVCERFALISAAGEMATYFSITGWNKGEAEQAASSCFKDWIDNRGSTSNQEETTILAQVKGFFEQHGNSRFTDWNDASAMTINRAGFKKEQVDGSVWYYVFPKAYNTQLCEGFEPKQVTKLLVKAEWLELDSEGKAQKPERLPGMGSTTRCYVFNSKIWDA